MPSENPAPELLEQGATLDEIQEAARGCTACDLYRNATQTVFGEGPGTARILLVGEQPGDEEDQEGEPFVGPAGRMLDQVLEEAGIDRTEVDVTNLVKHFKWKPRGKRRIHKKPNAEEIGACQPWLEAEIQLVQPEVVVCLGATASKALIGSDFRVTRQHGEFAQLDGGPAVTGVMHPSAVLRAPDSASRQEGKEQLVEDFRTVKRRLG